MNHDALIQALCDDLTPVQPMRAEQQMGQGLLAGGLVSLVILVLTLGVQPGLASTGAMASLSIKLGCMLAVGWIALRTLAALARPGAKPPALLIPLAKVMAVLSAVALAQLAILPQIDLMRFVMGASWHICPLRIAALSLPLQFAVFHVLRRQAPVALRRTGAVAGLCAGGVAAAIYAFACTEQSAGFVMLWYSLGVALASLVGMLLGPRVLHW